MADPTSSPLALFKLPGASLSGAMNTLLDSVKPAQVERSFSSELNKASELYKPRSSRQFTERSERQPEPGPSRDRVEPREQNDYSTKPASRRTQASSQDNPENKRTASTQSSERSDSPSTAKIEEAQTTANVKDLVETSVAQTGRTRQQDNIDQSTGLASNTTLKQAGFEEEVVADSDNKVLSETQAVTGQVVAFVSNDVQLRAGINASLPGDSQVPVHGPSALTGNKILMADGPLHAGSVDELDELKSKAALTIAGKHSVKVGDEVSREQLAAQSGAGSTKALVAGIDKSHANVLQNSELDSSAELLVTGRALRENTLEKGVIANSVAAEQNLRRHNAVAVESKMLNEAALEKDAELKLLNEQAAQKAHLQHVNRLEANMLEKVQVKLRAQMNEARTTMGSETSEKTIQPMTGQPSANTFHALNGGIVTAPIASRVEGTAVSTQPANAPFTMPLLSKDADATMASNIRWMVNEGVRQAVVNVSPSGMGPISVQIEMENEQLNVSILAAQGSTREALDALLPRLREQLMVQGHENLRLEVSDGRSDSSRNGNGQQLSEQSSDNFSNDDTGSMQSNDQQHDNRSVSRLINNESDDQVDSEAVSQNIQHTRQGEYDVYV